jgi:hypothetical protein
LRCEDRRHEPNRPELSDESATRMVIDADGAEVKAKALQAFSPFDDR